MKKYVKADGFMPIDIIYEDDEIIVKSTGRDYDFIATIENKTTDVVIVVFEGEYDYLPDIEIYDWVGILASDDGYDELDAIKTGNFYTIFDE